MDCPHPIKSVLPRFYPMWLSQTRPSMRIQRSEGLGSRLCEQSLRSPDNLLQVIASTLIVNVHGSLTLIFVAHAGG